MIPFLVLYKNLEVYKMGWFNKTGICVPAKITTGSAEIRPAAQCQHSRIDISYIFETVCLLSRCQLQAM